MFHLEKKKSHEIVYINRSYKRIENDNFTKKKKPNMTSKCTRINEA